jgi:hypothetical protein
MATVFFRALLKYTQLLMGRADEKAPRFSTSSKNGTAKGEARNPRFAFPFFFHFVLIKWLDFL